MSSKTRVLGKSDHAQQGHKRGPEYTAKYASTPPYIGAILHIRLLYHIIDFAMSFPYFSERLISWWFICFRGRTVW